jgi:hypothetical protein
MAARQWRALAVAVAVVVSVEQHAAAQESTERLAAAAQNPVAAMYSLPFQNSTYFGGLITTRPPMC